MIQLRIFDSLGVELNIGDIVQIDYDRNHCTYYARVGIVGGRLQPFQTFCYNSIKKVDKLPDDAIPMPSKTYPLGAWYIRNSEMKGEVTEHANHPDSWWYETRHFDGHHGFYKVSEVKDNE